MHPTRFSTVSFLCLAIFAVGAAAQPQAKGTIAGRVLSKPGGEPIRGAKIAIKSAADFFTDEDGTPKEAPVPLKGVVTEAITDVTKLPAQAVWVVVEEVDPPDWYVAGKAGERMKK